MLQIKGSSIKLTRGDDAVFSIDVYQPDGTLYTPNEGQRIVFSVSRQPSKEPNPKPVIQREFYQCETGQWLVEIKSIDTKFLEYGKYLWDCQFFFEDGEVNTVCSGMLELLYEIG